MAIVKSYVCDCGCGAVRGETNHWLMVASDRTGFSLMAWREGEVAEGYLHAAGSECVHRLLNAWMEKQREGK